MKVYVLIKHWEDEGDDIIAVYLEPIKAQEAAMEANSQDDYWRISYYVREMETA